MRTLAFLAAGLVGSALLAAPAEARTPAHRGFHRVADAPAPVYGRGFAARPVRAGIGLAAGAAGLAVGTVVAATDTVLGPSYGYRAGYADPLAPISYGGHWYSGLHSGLEYPIPNGFGGYYGNPDAFGGGAF